MGASLTRRAANITQLQKQISPRIVNVGLTAFFAVPNF